MQRITCSITQIGCEGFILFLKRSQRVKNTFKYYSEVVTMVTGSVGWLEMRADSGPVLNSALNPAVHTS